jgi:hypothetical protein
VRRLGVWLGLGLTLWLAWWTVPLPPQWDPWAPLNIAEPPNWLTPYKLMRLRGNPSLCQAALATSSLAFRAQADSPSGTRCPLVGVVRVSGGAVRLSSSFLATCPVAVAFALFERHGLQPAAQAAFNSRVVEVEHLGSYACRNVYHRAQGRLSQHATANALDIAAFRLANGRRISVLQGWPSAGEEAGFLRRVRTSACGYFSTVLGPDYNAAHRNHFHVDMSGWSVCR